MKKIFLTVMVALCTMGIVAAQDLEKATEIYNNAAAAIENDKAEAINLFEQALEMAGTLGDEGAEIVAQCKGILPKLYISLGKDLVNEKNLDEAIVKFQKAIEAGEKYGDADVAAEATGLIPQILMADANAKLNEKNFEGAVAGYQKVIDADPTNGNAHLRKGQALAQLGKMDDAIKAFELASENGQEEQAAKQLSNIYVKKAVACQKAKDMKGALENAQKSTQYVDNANAQKIIGMSAMQLKQNKVAAEAFEAYLAMNPNAITKEAGIVYNLGTALVALGENDKACGYFQKIAQDAKFGEGARYQITQLKCK
ncbi:MAG: tetratricopeptide repeat protein [Bacteroidales bacterium]|nr:tetratricopeptide repeat protein [Bacteroidales bacterium]MBR5018935.1 tetratricopeptide repeat protein [Bacteroidales bacterium]